MVFKNINAIVCRQLYFISHLWKIAWFGDIIDINNYRCTAKFLIVAR